MRQPSRLFRRNSLATLRCKLTKGADHNSRNALPATVHSVAAALPSLVCELVAVELEKLREELREELRKELYEEQRILFDTLCAAGVLTAGPHLRLEAARLRCICTLPALAERIAGFASTNTLATTSKALRAIRPVFGNTATEKVPVQAATGLAATAGSAIQSSATVTLGLFRSLFSGQPSAETGAPEGEVASSLATGMSLMATEAPEISGSTFGKAVFQGRGGSVARSATASSKLSADTKEPNSADLAAGTELQKGDTSVVNASANENVRGSAVQFLGRLLGYGDDEYTDSAKCSSVAPWLGVTEVLAIVARTAGSTAARQLSETGKVAAEGLGELLPQLSCDAPFVYVSGGNSGLVEQTERLSLATGCWEALPSMQLPRRACAAASTRGKFYVMGGSMHVLDPNEDQDQESRLECFNPATNSWELLPPAVRPFTHAAAGALGGDVYVFGGLSLGGVLDQAQRFSPKRRCWESLPPMPTPRFECAVAPHWGEFYVLGGANLQGDPLSVAEVFHPRSGKWRTLAPMPTARYGCAAAAVGGRMHAFGGRGGPWRRNLATCEAYDPSQEVWSALVPMITCRTHCGAVVAGGRIYVFGGHGDGHDCNTVDCLDPDAGSWEVAALMQPRSRCLAVVVQP